MAKQGTRAEVNSFVKGIITEASPLNYPADASVDEENFELNRDGTRDRRLGMDFEENHAYRSLPGYYNQSGSKAAVSSFRWYSINGLIGREFEVIQVANYLYFYDLEIESISGNGFLYATPLAFSDTAVYSFAAVEGRLVVAQGGFDLAVIEFVPASNTFTVVYQSLKVRDVWGIQELDDTRYETDPSFRGPPSQYHTYNLRNQSWGIPRRVQDSIITDPVGAYYASLGVYPSNSELVWPGLQYQASTTTENPFERMYTNLYEEVLGRGINAGKGYFVIDLLRRGQTRYSEYLSNSAKYPELAPGSPSFKTDYTPQGATLVCDFAGRVFYAGFGGQVIDGDTRSPDLSNYIAFSRLVKNADDITKCYQEGDPTSRDNSDLVDTDGGFIRISGAKKFIALVNLESSLIVIADNGVWAVDGGGQYGFTATNYKVTRISSYGAVSKTSVVLEGGRAFYWAEDGIYVIGKDNLGTLTVQSMTQTTIQTLYDSIGNLSKEGASGVYDMYDKKVRWIYREGDAFTSTSVTKELVFDTVLNAFYMNRVGRTSGSDTEIMGLFVTAPFKRGVLDTDVVVNSDLVLSGTDSVIISEVRRLSGTKSIKYLTIKKIDSGFFLTFSQYRDVSFLDWKSSDGVGVDAKAFLLTGDQIAQDSAVPKQMPYIVMHFRRTESGVTSDLVPDNQSSCFMRMQWSFANSIISHKWTPLVQVYRERRAQYITGSSDDYQNGFSVVRSKSKVRGRGPAFAMYLETEPLKDCRILGWNITINGNPIT